MDFLDMKLEDFYLVISQREGDPYEVRLKIEDQLMELEGEKTVIKEQLSIAKAKLLTEGKYSDPNWYQSASIAAKIKGRQIQKLQRLLGIVNKVEKEHRQKTRDNDFNARFVKAAKSYLTQDSLDNLMEIASQNNDNSPGPQ